VEWFHQKDYLMHAKVGASGSMQFIGGAIPPGSGGAPSKRRVHAGVLTSSSANILRVFKPIAAGGMVPPERLPTARKCGGLRKYKMPAIHWWSHSTRLWRCTFMYTRVLVSETADV